MQKEFHCKKCGTDNVANVPALLAVMKQKDTRVVGCENCNAEHTITTTPNHD